MNQKQFDQAFETKKEMQNMVNQDSWRLCYHIMPEQGWLNDPNGLCFHQGIYHVYYQYSPFDLSGKTKLWGHTTSKDLLHWHREEPVLFPDTSWDQDGVYSGSAFVKDDVIHFFYTGNVKLSDRDDYDFIHAGRLQNTIEVTSLDGYKFSEKRLVLKNEDYPSDMSCHVRDPKIYEKDGRFYMVLGARDRSSQGCVLLYESSDLNSWKYVNRIKSKEPFGYMWECPDLFELDQETLLLVCPQGIEKKGMEDANVHQCGCFMVHGDVVNDYTLSPFQQLDRGFDFYAPQSFVDGKGRRILIGWMGLPDIDYENPTTLHGWQHALSIPRVLHVRNGLLCQEPMEELQALRGKEVKCEASQLINSHVVKRVYELILEVTQSGSFDLQLRNETFLRYDKTHGILSLEIGKEGYGRKQRSVSLLSLHDLRIYSDTSSLEIFVNHGAVVFTTRVYESEGIAPVAFDSSEMQGSVTLYELMQPNLL